MEENNTPKKFSYPLADRSTDELSGQIKMKPTEGPVEANKPVTNNYKDALERDRLASVNNGINTLRTLEGDLANAIQKNNVSMVKMAMAEKTRQEKQGTFEEVVQQGNKNILYTVAAGILILLGIGGGLFVYFSRSNTPLPTDQTSSLAKGIESSLIYTEELKVIAIDGKDFQTLKKVINDEKNSLTNPGVVRRLVFTTGTGTTTKEVSIQDFLSIMRSRLPSELSRTMTGKQIFGIYSHNPTDAFTIIKTSSYDDSYSGMLNWEPYMEDDIGSLFIQRTDVISSTSTPVRKPFVDRVLENRDVRVLLNENGGIKMLYTFFDPNTIVITSNSDTLKEILFRLTNGKIVR